MNVPMSVLRVAVHVSGEIGSAPSYECNVQRMQRKNRIAVEILCEWSGVEQYAFKTGAEIKKHPAVTCRSQ